jgi:voltage-gated potassium channel
MSLFSDHRKVFKQRKFRQVLVISLTVALFLGIVIVPIERNHPDASIHSLSDGLWWAFQTLTTVGYGDATPVTTVGRLIAGILVLVGAILYGVMIAMLSSSMSRSQEEFYWIRLFERLDRYEEELIELRKRTEYLVKDKGQK